MIEENRPSTRMYPEDCALTQGRKGRKHQPICTYHRLWVRQATPLMSSLNSTSETETYGCMNGICPMSVLTTPPPPPRMLKKAKQRNYNNGYRDGACNTHTLEFGFKISARPTPTNDAARRANAKIGIAKTTVGTQLHTHTKNTKGSPSWSLSSYRARGDNDQITQAPSN